MNKERLVIIVMILLLPTLFLSSRGMLFGHGDEDDEYEERRGYGRDEDDEYEERRGYGRDDDDEYGEYGGGDEHEVREYLDPRRQGRLRNISPAVAPANNQAYIANCSDCHLAYSPNLLPERSWRKLMQVNELADHFGDYVEVEEADRQEILRYLVNNSAERASSMLANKILRSIPSGSTPLRISETRAIRKEHDDIPDKYTVNNAKVVSISQCQACHQQADKGVFDEDDVFIPYERLIRQ